MQIEIFACIGKNCRALFTPVNALKIRFFVASGCVIHHPTCIGWDIWIRVWTTRTSGFSFKGLDKIRQFHRKNQPIRMPHANYNCSDLVSSDMYITVFLVDAAVLFLFSLAFNMVTEMARSTHFWNGKNSRYFKDTFPLVWCLYFKSYGNKHLFINPSHPPRQRKGIFVSDWFSPLPDCKRPFCC